MESVGIVGGRRTRNTSRPTKSTEPDQQPDSNVSDPVSGEIANEETSMQSDNNAANEDLNDTDNENSAQPPNPYPPHDNTKVGRKPAAKKSPIPAKKSPVSSSRPSSLKKPVSSGTPLKRRHAKESALAGITKPAIRRLIRRAGGKRISGKVYQCGRILLQVTLRNVLSDAYILAAHRGFVTITAWVVGYALKFHGMHLYGIAEK